MMRINVNCLLLPGDLGCGVVVDMWSKVDASGAAMHAVRCDAMRFNTRHRMGCSPRANVNSANPRLDKHCR